MTDPERIDALEHHVERLEEELNAVRMQLAEAELDQWRGRIDDLELQAHLGSMDVGERMAPVIEELRNRWLDARSGLSDTANTASDVTDKLRKGLEQAMSDIRKTLLDVKSSVTG